ncbi:MAG TPA: sigma-70 family RNA polymerase sigma factor [Blastocatellia bacterium]|jgi:RNA polymerase sigma-70 factor (ECF subfamily)|nr:sigma-70 family RNA polymerase sigma factor [Blastocatellia bacterium]
MKPDMIEAISLVGQSSGRAGTLMNSSEELIARARRGEDEAFRLIFDRYGRPIISFIYDMVGRRELAEELTQETFVRAYKNLKALRDDTKLSTWLFGIAKNVARESLRRRHRESDKVGIDDDHVIELSDGKLPPDRQLLDKELNGVIRDALGALDEDKRLVFTLKIFQQRSYEEIAEITGSSIPKLKTDLHRARAEMRRRIRPYLGVGYEV